jgi:hypothetical protein
MLVFTGKMYGNVMKNRAKLSRKWAAAQDQKEAKAEGPAQPVDNYVRSN